MSDPTDAARKFLEDVQVWLSEKKLADLISKGEVLAVLEALRKDDAFWAEMQPKYEQAWARGEARLRAEKRPLKEMLSDEAVQKLLDGAEAMEPDPEAVRAFLRSPAVETALGQTIYDGIFEFMKKADLFGALLNKLPVIGPIRKKLMAVVAEEVEPRLEGQVKAFLGGFSGKAVEKLIQRVLAPEHREGFRAARRRLAEHFLGRPIASLVPDEATTARWRTQLWESLRKASFKDEGALLDQLFADHGDIVLGKWAVRSRPATDVVARSLGKFLETKKDWRLERGS